MEQDLHNAASEYLAGSVRIGCVGGLIAVPCSAFTIDDFSVAMARGKEAYRPNKANSRVLRMLEEMIATAALERVGTRHGWPIENRQDDWEKNMRSEIPSPVISVVAAVLDRRETHAKMNSLFLYANAPGDAPEGNKLNG